ncbi:polysaccharide deacetylase [Lichenibacterium minor]|uniref:Chitooligosaccharide deacetylase n=1 Tax=Lichenibacterium minor TaxID=2316528 RepID=A0A4Q2UCL0_9HYPH|nr:polysaccharide deacetylase family protein [Lichenibacterium minor]RYC32907.1 polysaccharide deacetylase [Lichenibacterium minor]
MRDRIIGAGFSALGATGLHRWAAPRFRGLGAILMFHHVRPGVSRAFDPNGMLEITPAFLDAALTRVRALGYRMLSIDQAVDELRAGGTAGAPPFAVLTFDDGYRDNLVHALPVLEKHRAPFTVYVTSGFADRTARLWWVELEEAVRRGSRVALQLDGETLSLPAGTAAEKRAAFKAVYWPLRGGAEDRLLAAVGALAQGQGIDGRGLVEDRCMDWPEIESLARHPLATIGAHTLTHPRLARLDIADMRTELGAAKTILEERLGRPVVHLAYPVGDPGSAGRREFDAAKAFGYASAVTTRPGLVHAGHAAHLTALPRVSVNGLWQDLRHFEVLLSGAAFALWNRGRRVNVA